MVTALRVITAGIGIWLLVIGLGWMFAPGDLSAQFAVTLNGVQGMNTGRGDLGGMFLAGGALCLLGIRQHPSSAGLLYAFAILMGAVALGRIVGFVLDGPQLLTVVPFLVELVFIVITCLLAGKQSPVRAADAD